MLAVAPKQTNSRHYMQKEKNKNQYYSEQLSRDLKTRFCLLLVEFMKDWDQTSFSYTATAS